MPKLTYKGVMKVNYNSDSQVFEVTRIYHPLTEVDGFLNSVYTTGSRFLTVVFEVTQEVLDQLNAKPEVKKVMTPAEVIPLVEEPPEVIEVDLVEAEVKVVDKSALESAFDALLPKEGEEDGTKEE